VSFFDLSQLLMRLDERLQILQQRLRKKNTRDEQSVMCGGEERGK